MNHTKKSLFILSTTLIFSSYIHSMEPANGEEKPQENSGIMHYASKLLFPKSYVCDPENNARYLEYKEKIESTSVEKLRSDAKFWEDFKRITERHVKMQGVIEAAIQSKDLDTLTLLLAYNDELPNPLDLVKKALTEGQVKINRALKKDTGGHKQ